MGISKCFWRPIDAIGCRLVGPSFVGGFSVKEVLATGAELKRRDYKITYNLLGEHVERFDIVERALRTTKELVSAMDDTNSGNVSAKPTLYGLQISYDTFFRAALVLADLCREKGIELEFDAETYKFLPDTFRVFKYFASRLHYRGFVRQAVQEHLVDIFDLMDEFELWDKKLRLVKGSGVYPESKKIVWRDNAQILRQHETILRRNHMEGQVPYVAAMRDRDRIERAKKILSSPYMFEFQTLYGPFVHEIFDELIQGEDLRAEAGGLQGGWPVRVYIPFADEWCKNEWIPYGMRRSYLMRGLFLKDPMVRRIMRREALGKIGRVIERHGELSSLDHGYYWP